jgi:hypothetical protein
MPRLKPPPKKPAFAPIEVDDLPEEPIEIDLSGDDSGEVTIDLAQQLPEPEETPAPPPRREKPAAPAPAPEDDPLAKALAAQQRAEEMQRQAERLRDEAVRRERERQDELEKERTDREDAEYNSVLTAIAAETSALEKAESDYAAFLQAQDWANAAKAQRVMSTAASRLDRLEDGKRTFETRKDAAKTAPPKPAPAAPGDPVDTQIAAMQMPENAKSWLRGHKEFLTDPRKNAKLQAAHFEALDEAGGQMGSPKYIEALEVTLGLKTHQPASPEPAPQPQPPRRSIQVSAPVSRDAPSPSGKRVSDSKMTLTPEEVDIARRSIIDRPDMPPLTNAQKEYIYAQNKRRYQTMKANGTYSEQKG